MFLPMTRLYYTISCDNLESSQVDRGKKISATCNSPSQVRRDAFYSDPPRVFRLMPDYKVLV